MDNLKNSIESLTTSVNVVSAQQQILTNTLAQNNYQNVTNESPPPSDPIDRPEPFINERGRKDYKVYQ